MALIYFFGDVPVSKEEVEEKNVIGNFNHLLKSTLESTSKLEFRGGDVNVEKILDNSNLNIPDFTPIGINKPLSVELLSVYTGDAPSKFLGGKKDMLLVSGVKSFSTYEAAPKAINMLRKKIAKNDLLKFGAFEEGSPIVYYSKAVDSSTLFLSYQLIADTFSEHTFKLISNLFKGAAGLPIFAPAAPYLLAGSVLSSIIGNIGKVIFSSKPFLSENEDIRFDTPNMLVSMAKQFLICNESDKDKFKDFAPGIKDEKVMLLSKKDGKPYIGDAPYIILNRDGRERNELAEYTPKLASAALLEKFYGPDDKLDRSFEVLQTAMTLYNDFEYTKKARNLEKSMEQFDKNSNEYKKAKELLSAYKKNIVMDEFKN